MPIHFTAEFWSFILGLGMPLLIAVVQQPKWSDMTRRIVAVALSAAVGLGNAYFSNRWNAADIGANVVLVIAAAQAAFNLFYSPSGTTKAIERATSPKG